MKKTVIFTVILLFFGGVFTPVIQGLVTEESNHSISDGNTLYVGGTGPGNYSSIQDAIDNASDGYTVFVFNGTYRENIVVDKSINLFGEFRDTTFILGYWYEEAVINITADWVNISGFTINRGDNSGIKICSAHCTITRNNILDELITGIEICSNFNIISDNNISQFWQYGIYLSKTTIGNSIMRNNITFGAYEIGYGIILDSSNNNTILGNLISNNTIGIHLQYSSNNTILLNNINSNINGIENHYNSTNNIIMNNNFSKNWHDISLHNSNNNTVAGNIISENKCCCCIFITNSNSNIITGNWIIGRGGGIEISYYSANNIISHNDISNSYIGISIIISSKYNLIINNTISNNSNGINIWYSSSNNNTLINNTISNNKQGIYIEEFCSNNSIYHNNFFQNTENAYDEGNNTWDDGYPSGGNFWDDYNGTDADGDGIGDTPYPIPGGNNKDNYPLGNFPPDKPDIDGPSKGKAGVEHIWVLHSEDPECESIYFYIDWGDGNIIDWFGPHPSCMPVEACHTYEKTGSYVIGVKVKDIYDAESDIAEFEVEIPRNRTKFNSLYHWLLNRFQMLERLLALIKIM